MSKLKERVNLVFNSKKPFKLLLAYFLRKFKISHLFIIDKCLYKMRFYPSALLMHYWVNKNAREDEAIFLTRLVKIGSTVIDVGANVGTLSLPLSYRVTHKGKVVSIEASPTTYNYLKGNIELNRDIQNIIPINVAIGDTTGEIYFSNISSDDMNKVVDESEKDAIKVPMKTLDSIILEQGIKRIRLLKIDIEGYELFALKGASNTLDMCDIVFFESWEKHFKGYGYSTIDTLDLLAKKDFKIFRIIEDSLVEINLDYISMECENLIAFKNLKDIDCLYEKN